MPSIKQWQAEITAGGNKSSLTAKQLFDLYRTASSIYSDTVRETTFAGRGVSAHEGNNEKQVILSGVQMIAHGWNDIFDKTASNIAMKASREPVRYRPLSYAFQHMRGAVEMKPLVRAAHH